MINNLWIVMPVYNEEESIEYVINEWSTHLNLLGIDYVLCALNDGSKDRTLEKLNELSTHNSHLMIVDKENTGHGQSCLEGYKIALQQGADWIFQIDSDGQCDPRFFKQFLEETATSHAIFGYRKTREDGFARYLISRFVSVFTFAATYRWIKDANVPYRLMHRSVLEKAIQYIDKDFFLVNIYLSVLISTRTKIKWIDIVFRDRYGGSPSIKTFSFFKHGATLYKQLKQAKQKYVNAI